MISRRVFLATPLCALAPNVPFAAPTQARDELARARAAVEAANRESSALLASVQRSLDAGAERLIYAAQQLVDGAAAIKRARVTR